MDITTEKQKSLAKALNDIEKSFGKGSIMKLGERPQLDIETVKTGSILLDHALGIGGWPKGRIIEIYGPESSGKTTLALHAIAEGQKSGEVCAMIDAEHALDPIYAKNLGVNIDDLYISQPNTGEEALEICEALIRSHAVGIIVIDSVAALVPRAEIDGEMGEGHVGLHARLMSQALRKLTGAISKSNCIVIFINQIREKIGISYGNPEVTTGGRALKFYATIRVDIRKKEPIKQAEQIIGNRIHIKIVKNKVAPPFRQVDTAILFGQGLDYFGEVLDKSVDLDILKKSGAWYSYNSENIAQGRENARTYLMEHTEVLTEVEQKIEKALQPAPVVDNKDSDETTNPS